MSEDATVVDLGFKRSAAKLDQMLAKTEKNQVIGNVSNLILIIGHDPVLSGLCGYDEFQCLPVIHNPAPSPIDDAPSLPGPYPRAWSAADVSQIQSYIQRIWVSGAKKGDVEDAMNAVAASRRFHPIRDWLDGLTWDREPRLNQWLRKAFGADDTEYVEDVSSCTLIAAVRRVRKPGCKFDHMPVLEGAQGIGKSTAVKALFGAQFFTDNLPLALESKDAALGLQGAWCVEFAEIEQLIRAEAEIAKAFLSRSVDRFRAPYGKTFLSYPRQCVFIGTTNDSDYLRDATGNRRFWPILCRFVEIDWITTNREQIWAEAAYRESLGEDHWLSEETTIKQAAEAQQDRQQEDVWEDCVKLFLVGKTDTSTADVLTDALKIPIERQTRREQIRVSAIMKKLQWQRVNVRSGASVTKRWKKDVLRL